MALAWTEVTPLGRFLANTPPTGRVDPACGGAVGSVCSFSSCSPVGVVVVLLVDAVEDEDELGGAKVVAPPVFMPT